MEQPKVQFGASQEADFHERTWTFKMANHDFAVTAGRYAILTEKEYRHLLRVAER